jgi:hypothetical protein
MRASACAAIEIVVNLASEQGHCLFDFIRATGVPLQRVGKQCSVIGCTLSHTVPKPPSHLKIRRAKTVVDDAGVKVLTKCERCSEEKYIVEVETVCEECISRPGKRKVRKTR